MRSVVSAEDVVAGIPDPELPHLTIGDLGIVRSVDEHDGLVSVAITPTYSGCPATEVIAEAVVSALRAAGYHHVAVRTVLHPPWTSDFVTADGREKLRRAGIAPPGPAPDPLAGWVAPPVACPRCGSRQTVRRGDFGATACKAPYTCRACAEPFEHFKAF